MERKKPSKNLTPNFIGNQHAESIEYMSKQSTSLLITANTGSDTIQLLVV